MGMIKEYISVLVFSCVPGQEEHRLIPGCHPKGIISDASERVGKTGHGYGETSAGLCLSPGVCKHGTFQARSAIFAISQRLTVISFNKLSGQVLSSCELPTSAILCNQTHHNLPLRRKGNPYLARSTTIATKKKKGRLAGGATSSPGLVYLKACLSGDRSSASVKKYFFSLGTSHPTLKRTIPTRRQ